MEVAFNGREAEKLNMEYEYHTETRLYGNPMTQEELAGKAEEGWEDYTPEPGISFMPTSTEVLAGPSIRYVFRKKKS